MSKHHEMVVVLDFGGQYNQLIARRIRDLGVYSELIPYNTPVEKIKEMNPKGIVFSGGPSSVYEENAPHVDPAIYDIGLPIFGICYGMQLMSHQNEGKVQRAGKREYGKSDVVFTENCDLIKGLEVNQTVWMSHGDKVTEVPNGFDVSAHTDSCPIAAIVNNDKKFYGVQFHPEVTHTKSGAKMLENFVKGICGLEGMWTPSTIIDDAVAKIKAKVGNNKVMLGLSGGVDSSVTALLLHKAIGDNLTCVFVDNGLLRLNEGNQVREMFGDKFGLNIVYVDAEDRFLDALKGVSDPEAKRKTIGRVFIDVFADEARKLSDVKFLAQGTIYPDVIESAASKTGKAHVIKSHHNVGGLPDDLKFELVEPLRELFKDEVRKVGLALGLPYDMLYRHPFPGPGLGVRVLGEIKKEYCDLLRQADAIFIEELYKAEWYHKVSQAFVVFLPVRSVGVMGDGRKYDYVVSLRAVETIDFMTAHWAELPYDLLGKVSNRIINEINGISRVVYDISGKPPATIEWE